MDHGSRILDLRPWTLFWHERPFQNGSGRDIKTNQIHDQISIILDRCYKDRVMDQASWTLFWHERPFQKGSRRDIKTAQIYNRFSIMLFRFWKLKQAQNDYFRRPYTFCMIFIKHLLFFGFFILFWGSFQDILNIPNHFFDIDKSVSLCALIFFLDRNFDFEIETSTSRLK